MKAQLTFTKCIQDVQDIGTQDAKDDRMVSRLFFTLQVGEKQYLDMQLEVRQPHGFVYDDSTTFPIEVSLPTSGFKGPWHHESLSNAAEDYYRGIVGTQGRAVRFPAGARVHMEKNTILLSKRYEIEIPSKGTAW